MRWVPGVFLLAVFFFAAGNAAAADEGLAVVGEVTQIKGDVARFDSSGTAHRLDEGDAVYVRDRIETRTRSTVTLRFQDNTSFSLGPDSAFSIDEFKYARADTDSVAMEVLRGAFRFTTGLIAKARSRSMQVRTGVVATIGIRGTTVGGEVVGESATIVLLEPEDGAAASAIEVGNAYGSVVIDQPGYGTTVPDAHSPPTPPQRMRLRAIDNLLRSIQSSQRVSVPRP
jgi:hypothetical protein